MRSIKQIKDIKGKTVMVRVDFNLPIKGGTVADDFRIKKTLPTIDFLQKKGAKIILITHLGKGGETAAPVADALDKFTKITFIPEITGEAVIEAVKKMKGGDVILLENLRNDPGEKGGSADFAKKLAALADIYVNESFPVDHREDASIVLLPKLLPSYAGFQLEEEIKNLSQAFENPKRPFLFILGGAKFATKLPLIKKYLDLADHVFVGGALSNDFLKARGYEVGKSLKSDEDFGIEELLQNKKLIAPIDVLTQSDGKLINKKVSQVGKDDIILDVGEETLSTLEPFIKEAELILWNGPLGKYEAGGGGTTKKALQLVADSKAKSIIGGGDLVSVLSSLEPKSYKLKPNLFVSTGGGATLDFLANGTLPGIEALK
ncbi:phosphoglycerate kinase [Candidatus Nomurabacteria bacterium]|nr:phosphoglycerate kinase [Candidatus Nomurabacteria bacterium]